MNRTFGKHFLDWRLPAPLESEYAIRAIAASSPRLRRLSEVISAVVWGLYFISPVLGWFVPPLMLVISLQMVLLVGYLTLFSTGGIRTLINYIWPLIPMAFIWLFVEFYVSSLAMEKAVQTQGMVIVIIMMIFAFEVLNPVVGVFAGVVSSLLFLWLRSRLPLEAVYGTQQIYAQLVIVNAIGVYLSFSQNRSRRQEFYLEKLLDAERLASDALLMKVFPQKIAERLKLSGANLAENYSDVSVLFADLVGFTKLSSTMAPARLVSLLDELFAQFDLLADSLGVEKIKTIGDAYLAVAGCPVPASDHAARLSRFALGLASIVAKFSASAGMQFSVRVGIHSGTVVAGVVGNKRISFDLWGDTVNIASRMESLALPGEVLVSESTAELLRNDFRLSPARTIDVKGKGPMAVYTLMS